MISKWVQDQPDFILRLIIAFLDDDELQAQAFESLRLYGRTWRFGALMKLSHLSFAAGLELACRKEARLAR